MPSVVAIVDTNFYRGTPDEIVEDLRWLESRAGVKAIASFHATTELLAHMASRTDPSYGVCRAALKRLWRHCAVYSITDSGLPLAADPNGMIAKTIFDRRAPWGYELAINMATLVKRIALRDGEPTPELLNDLTAVRRFRDEAESRFAMMLRDTRRQLGLNEDAASDFAPSDRPTSRNFLESGVLRRLAAHALVLNCASELRLKLNDRDVAQRASILESHIPTALRVFESAIEQAVSAGAAPDRCANSLWDLHLALFAAESMRVGGHPVVVVTDDKPIQRAAAATGASGRVFSLSSYRDFLLTRVAA